MVSADERWEAVAQRRAGLTGGSPDADGLVRALGEVVAAIDQARALGLPLAVPESLHRACAEIVSRHETSSGTREPAVPPGGRGGSAVTVWDVPLRRLVWRVIGPVGEFAVCDVAEGLAALGAPWPSTSVSNALGYWVARGRLVRVRKGVYARAPSAAAADAGAAGPASPEPDDEEDPR